ncbi:MAG: hypothetical protein N3D11_05610 [Candidatus Sumerlaeia bacterium]|nr:hypothetical protein [Candidatus Sumerlaeia bacterium]
MNRLRLFSTHWTWAASAGAAFLVLSAAIFIVGRYGTAAEEPLPEPPTSTLVPTEPVPPVIVSEPPSEAPIVAMPETSPTAAAAFEGGIIPIEDMGGPLREMDETAPINIFADPAVVAKLLVPRKVFLYDAKGRRDPMIIDWIRMEIVNSELLAQAQTYIAEATQTTDPEARKARYLLAIQELDRVIKTDPTSHQGKQAQAMKDKVRALIDQTTQATLKAKEVTKPPELPPYVPANTRAIVLDQSPRNNHLVLIGDDLLRVGEVVPKYPEVKIAEINRNTVVYEYKGTRVTVVVEVPTARE